MEKKCLKCQHNANVPGLTTDACPQCGAIYAKVEEYLRNNQAAVPPRRASAAVAQTGRDVFIAQLRQDSLYPTARWWTNLVHAIVTIMCIIFGVGSLAAIGNGFVGGALIVLVFIVLLWLASRVMKELTQMFIDMCDASVRTAYQQERQSP